LVGTTCVNCLTLIGANGKASATSCVCIKGYVWNSGSSKCDCDWRQNHILINSVCRDCRII
jgi:hypothetical protein